MVWYEELDFEENPFTTNPKRFTNALVNVDDVFDEALYRIKSGNMFVLEGKDGFGKTSLLMALIKKLKGREKIIYVDCETLDKKLSIGRILVERHGIIERMLKPKPRKQILMLDNVQNLTKANNERIKYYFDQDYFKSVVFTTKGFAKMKISDSLRQRIGKRIGKINTIDQNDAIEIIRNRISNSSLLTDELIIEIFKRSGKNPRKMLDNCSTIAKHAYEESKRDRIQFIDIESILGGKNGNSVV